jgi:hypothetical protein
MTDHVISKRKVAALYPRHHSCRLIKTEKDKTVEIACVEGTL